MNKTIQSIPISNGLLFIKNFEIIEGKMYLDYKSSHNDMPFARTEVWMNGTDIVICGDNGDVHYRFSVKLLDKIQKEK